MSRNGLRRLLIAAATAALVSASASPLVTFAIDHEGVVHDLTAIPSPGQTPFGFALGGGRQLFVSEAAGGAANASSVTSWRIAREGDPRLVDPNPTKATLQFATCWVAVTPDGQGLPAGSNGRIAF